MAAAYEHRSFAVYLLLLFAAACGPNLIEKAAQLRQKGLHKNAAEMYLKALGKKATDPEALSGLRFSGQKVLDELAGRAEAAYDAKHYTEALELYGSVFAFKSRVERYKVTLHLDPKHRTFWEDAKDTKARTFYDQGNEFLNAGQFGDAERVFAELQLLRPGFRDADQLRNEAIYKQGLHLLDEEQWRAAYEEFAGIATYKQSSSYKRQALEKGRIAIALLPVDTAAGHMQHKQILRRLYGAVLQNLTGRNDPFIAYVDRSNTSYINRERRGGPLVDPSTAVELGKHYQAKYLAKISLTGYDLVDEPAAKIIREAMNWDGREETYTYTTKIGVEKTATRLAPGSYRKVAYFDYVKTREVTLSIEVQVIDVASSAIAWVRTYRESAASEAHYAEYSGDPSRLYHFREDGEGEIELANKLKKSKFRISARKVKSADQLLEECIGPIYPKIADVIASVY